MEALDPKTLKSSLVENAVFTAWCYKCYDSDTIDVMYNIREFVPCTADVFMKAKVRLARVDSPEMKSAVDVEKALATAGRDYLRSRILKKNICLKTTKMDKYGRILADVFIDNVNINDELIAIGMVREYSGGKKTAWSINADLTIN